MLTARMHEIHAASAMHVRLDHSGGLSLAHLLSNPTRETRVQKPLDAGDRALDTWRSIGMDFEAPVPFDPVMDPRPTPSSMAPRLPSWFPDSLCKTLAHRVAAVKARPGAVA